MRHRGRGLGGCGGGGALSIIITVVNFYYGWVVSAP